MDIDDRAKIDRRFEVLASELADLRAENQRLAAEVSALSPHRPEATLAPMQEGLGQGPLSRRNALRALGGAAVAGAGLVATGVIGAEPAAAGVDGDLVLGSTTANSASSPTGLTVTGTSSFYGIGATDNGLSVYPGIATAAVFGHSHSQNFDAGVLGYADNGGYGVYGYSPGGYGIYGQGSVVGILGFGGGGIGVQGDGQTGVQGIAESRDGVGVQGSVRGAFGVPLAPASGMGMVAEVLNGGGGAPLATSVALSATNEGLGTGVTAASTSGIGVSAQGGRAQLLLVPAGSTGAPGGSHGKGELFLDSAGSLWLCTVTGNPATWVRVITSGVDPLNTSGPGLQINQAGTGHALLGDITNPANTNVGVYGLSAGSGQAVKGYNTGTGMGVYGQVNNAANASPAVQGYTNGKGPGVEGNQVGTGYGVLGNVANAANSMAAVRAVTNGTGPALQGAGGRAQLNLVPAPTAGTPATGQRGDLFVDVNGVLYFCTTGSPVTWKQVHLV